MDRPSLRRDALVAGLLALVLGIGWTLSRWPALAVLHLPDTDDVMRLQQVRDWIGGQRFADLAQHRLGAGVPMHWSRIADFAPAALILGLRPSIGTPMAEIAAVIVWPIVLFGMALFLIARIARRVGAPAGTAAVVAALAYPATTVFLPGRIDHHGLQVVLLLVALAALLRPIAGVGGARRARAAGGVIAFAAVASLIVGLETAPLFVIVGAAVAIGWIVEDDRGRFFALGAAATLALVLARWAFASDAFAWPACDGFTRDSWHVAQFGAGGALVLGCIGQWLPGWRRRLGAAAIVGAGVVAIALQVSPRCLSPYGAVDPRLAQLWLSQVGEAQPLWHANPANAIGYTGLLVAGIAATAWRCYAIRQARWALLLGLLLGSFVVSCAQLRGAYPGAMLAAPGLAAAIAAARRRGTAALAGAWLGSAGLLYPIAAQAIVPRSEGASRSDGDCTGGALVARLAALPPGVVLAPIDAGPYLLAATPHRLVAAPYHRNGAGNLAMFAAYGADPAQALAVLRAWRVDTVLACNGMPGGRSSLAARLREGKPPGIHLLYRAPDGAAIYRMAR